MFESLGLTVEVVSMYPGTRAAFSPRVVIRRRALHHGPVIRGRTAPWRRLWLAPLVGFKRVDWALAMRRYRRYMGSLGPETLVLFTHVAPLALLMEAGFGWGRSRPLLVGQHHSPFDSIEEDAVLGEDRAPVRHVDGFVALTKEDAALRPGPPGALRAAEPCPGGAGRHASGPGQWAGRPRMARLSPVCRRSSALDLMIRAFARDRAVASPLGLDIYGEGQERAALEGVVAEVGAGDRIRLMGRVDDVGPVLAGVGQPVDLPVRRAPHEHPRGGTVRRAHRRLHPHRDRTRHRASRTPRPSTGDEEAYVEALRRVLGTRRGCDRPVPGHGKPRHGTTRRSSPPDGHGSWRTSSADRGRARPCRCRVRPTGTAHLCRRRAPGGWVSEVRVMAPTLIYRGVR